ncbi:uncharacterized protein LOC111294899 [Durio zibethinus]|uniref:Uncharacterized protein LOC111294899 n=1 Tax=Durio zibethinus TaxID=66656 RepID=A0A6P5YTW8_DURZI|nr:uncharacterized protein LOC111294899 [Durio zibethinus]
MSRPKSIVLSLKGRNIEVDDTCANQEKKLETCMYTLWMIWSNRNWCFHDSTCVSVSETAFKVGRMLSEGGELSHTSDRDDNGREVLAKWKPPEKVDFKINVDAVFDCKTLTAGLGMVVREKNGRVVLCAVTNVVNVQRSLHAEMNAVLFGVDGFDVVEVETDASIMVTEIDKAGDSNWEGTGITLDVLSAALQYIVYCFLHVNRTANTLAHNVAKIRGNVG